VKSRIKNVKSTVSVCILEGTDSRASGIRGFCISSSAEISGFLEFQLHVEGIVFLKLP